MHASCVLSRIRIHDACVHLHLRQVSSALKENAARADDLEIELQRARADAVELAKFYDMKSAQAERLQQQVRHRQHFPSYQSSCSALVKYEPLGGIARLQVDLSLIHI